MLQGKPKAAIAFADQALRVDPVSIPARLIVVDALLTDGNIRRAESEAKLLTSRLDTLPRSHIALGSVHARKGERAAARREFERALTLAPDLVDALTGLVTLDIADGRASSARAAVEARLARQPKNVSLLLLAARTYTATNEHARAERALRDVLAVDGSHTAARTQLARVYVTQRKLDQARREYDTIVAQDPKNIAAHTQAAMILQVQGKRAEAVQRYETIIEIDPNAAVASNNLALLYAEEGRNLDVALQLAQAAKRRLPDNPAFSDTLGWIYYRKGLETLAIPAFRESVGKDRPIQSSSTTSGSPMQRSAKSPGRAPHSNRRSDSRVTSTGRPTLARSSRPSDHGAEAFDKIPRA